MARKLTEDQKALYDKLSSLQKHMANAHLNGMSCKECYIYACKKVKKPVKKRAKNKKAAGHQTLTLPSVMAYIRSVKEPAEDKAANDAIMSRDEALERLTKMGRGELSRLVEFGDVVVDYDDEGKPIVNMGWQFKASKDINPDDLALIKELSSGKEGLKIKLQDAESAIKQLRAMEGWDAAQKHEVVVSDEELTPWGSITSANQDKGD